jgi:hypothetical protein
VSSSGVMVNERPLAEVTVTDGVAAALRGYQTQP